ncbi:hypothetical protein ACNTMW_31030 [Planosporangium sp. 12N6]|uniref:hypothetical protein n=1 Tax=Planosporangium spinosum TaxID=3402278 RepID=UPI003CF7F466
MAKGINIIKAARKKGVTGLAWASLVIALAGGALATDTWMGHLVKSILRLLPWEWLPAVLLAAAVIGTGLDLFLDGVPNQVAIASALLAPSVASATRGKLGATVTDRSGQLLAWIDRDLTGWLGTDSSTGLAIGCIVAAVLMARRVVKKSKSTTAVAV